MTLFLKSFVKETKMPVDDKVEDHSYDYVAIQIITKYLRSKNYNGNLFDNSAGKGKAYVFFYGSDTSHSPMLIHIHLVPRIYLICFLFCSHLRNVLI